jgi:DNA-binding GntR family transcriptional regulator
VQEDAPGKPAYQQIADDLRNAISHGRIAIGEQVGSTAQLMARYRVSSTVARKAVDQLRVEGIVVGRPGKGVYVRATPAQVAAEVPTLARLADQVEELRRILDGRGDADGAHSLNELRDDMAELRRQVATVEVHLAELYARVGQPYPHEPARDAAAPERRRSKA